MHLPGLRTIGSSAFAIALVTVCALGAANASSNTSRPGAPNGGDSKYRDIPLDASRTNQLSTKADDLGRLLGFKPGAKHSGRHVSDPQAGEEFDEIETSDDAGPVSAIRFDGSDQLSGVVTFEQPATPSDRANQGQAESVARRAMALVGFKVQGSPELSQDRSTYGWTVQWQRQQAGRTVIGDAVVIHVFPNGQIESMSRSEHPLAAEPAKTLTKAEATQWAATHLASLTSSSAKYTLMSLTLAWASPNQEFDANRPLDPAGTKRLCWVASYQDLTDSLDAVQILLNIDAGDGSLLGGGVVG